MRSPSATPLAVLALAAPALASNWIVDDDGGPGVDFASIADALAVAVPGDVVTVRAGSYGAFTLALGVQVLGEPNALVTGEIRVQDVPAGPRATLARLGTREIVVSNCAAAVLLEDLVVHPLPADIGIDGAGLTVTNAVDVRVRNADVRVPDYGGSHAVRVISSRFEITHSSLVGGQGQFAFHSQSYDRGGDGLWASGPSDVHVSRCTIRGGQGGTDDGGCEWCIAGQGGSGIRLQDASTLLLTGLAGDLVQGGHAGLGGTCSSDGEPGIGISAYGTSSARVSGASIQAGGAWCPGGGWPTVGAVTFASPADPCLTITGSTLPGTSVTYVVHGAPGSSARLRLGRQVIVQDLPDVIEDRLTLPLRTFDLGTLPPSGSASFTMNLPSALPEGFAVVAQASVVATGGVVALTQSLPITLH